MAAGLTVGASAPVFGLIGALYHYGRTASSSIKQQATSIILQAVVFGLLMPGIDNYAHAGGFAGGPKQARRIGSHCGPEVVIL
jgi:rhomboid protease GluP